VVDVRPSLNQMAETRPVTDIQLRSTKHSVRGPNTSERNSNAARPIPRSPQQQLTGTALRCTEQRPKCSAECAKVLRTTYGERWWQPSTAHPVLQSEKRTFANFRVRPFCCRRDGQRCSQSSQEPRAAGSRTRSPERGPTPVGFPQVAPRATERGRPATRARISEVNPLRASCAGIAL